MEAVAAWVRELPIDRPFVLGSAAIVVLLVLLRWLVGRTRSGARLVRAAHGAEGGLLALLLLAMILLSFTQIMLRNLADSGFVWIDPLLRQLVLWVGFLGAMLASRVGRHISVDALSRFLPPQGLRISQVATNLLAAIVCLLLSNACLKLVRDEADVSTTAFLSVPTWIVQLIMPLALWVMSYRFLGHVCTALRGDRAPSMAQPLAAEADWHEPDVNLAPEEGAR